MPVFFRGPCSQVSSKVHYHSRLDGVLNEGRPVERMGIGRLLEYLELVSLRGRVPKVLYITFSRAPRPTGGLERYSTLDSK